MDRVIVYPGEIPQDTDLLNTNRYAMVGLGAALQAILGAGPYVDGLACTPGTGLAVNIGPGVIFSQAGIDATAYGSLASDTGDLIVKQGLTWGQTSVALGAPGTVGQSVVWLIEAQFQESDSGSTSLPYYNSANPSQPLWTTNPTVRKGICALQAKQGTPAATGSQVAPAADAGWAPIYAVTVAYGASSIVGGNIATASGAPFIATKLPGMASQAQVQNNSLCYVVGGGTANAHTATYAPAVTALADGMVLEFQAANANTGASTFAPNGLTAKPIVGGAHQALQGGEIVNGGKVELMYHSGLASWVLVGCTGGAVQVGSATKSQQAPMAGQVQSNGLCYAAGGGTANAHTATYTPAVTALTDGMVLEFQAANSNTGAATFSPNGLAAKAIVGGAHQALQGGEIVAGGEVELMWNASLNSWVLLGCTGGALQVGTATQSQHAVTLAQAQAMSTPAMQQYFFGQL